jgi:beta-lactamase regulating signal transducer with metallopeptidase domain
MIRRARRDGRIRVDVEGQVYQSSEVTVPMTVGAIRPVIVLPVTWKTWDSDTLAAIMAHEAAHVRRRDASINFAAHLNRAIFWVHPLAWWLERKLAVTAEHACDEAAARASAAPGRYAEILVEMADVVRRNRGRLAWQAVGVNGAGLLDSRIDRLLRAMRSPAPRAEEDRRGNWLRPCHCDGHRVSPAEFCHAAPRIGAGEEARGPGRERKGSKPPAT